MLKRLRVKIICITMVIVALMLGIIFCTVYHFTRENLETESIRMMEAMASNPFQLGRPNEMPEEIRLPYFVIQLGAGNEIISVGGGYYDLSDREFLQSAVTEAMACKTRSGVLEDYKLRFMIQPSIMGGRIVFADISSEQAALSSLVKTSILIGAAAMLVFFGAAILFARMAVKPVEKAWEQQRQFVADASHELKTPLTVIITNTELMKSPDYSGEEKSRFLDSIQTMSSQMRGLTESLLTLARVDADIHPSQHERLDFSYLTGQEIMSFEPLFFEKDLLLTSELESSIMLSGRQEELRRLVDILLDNAMKYSSARSEVLVQLRRHGKEALLSVANHGQELSDEDLRNIFKRFYRADKARSMNHSYGLGLPIAEGIVRSHRGKIWSESSGGINRFHVSLPL